jgi:ubiquinone/menaquinone biosynthesis C-methylase UbiE
MLEIEKKKYHQAWETGAETNSRTAQPFAKYVDSLKPQGKILDLGFGNGLVVTLLKEKGYDMHGVDITLNGLNQKIHDFKTRKYFDLKRDFSLFTEGTLWDLPFEDNSFDLTISCDVLEHIHPELIGKTIKEIIRVTKNSTIHVIPDFKHKDFHLTVKPIIWWIKQFEMANTKNISLNLFDRGDFLKGRKSG